MTDAEYVLSQLEQGPRDTTELLVGSIRERGVGLTVHSRVADLRRDGYDIRCTVEGRTRKDRARYVYRLQERRVVEPPARGHEAPGAEIPAPVPDVIPGQLRLVG